MASTICSASSFLDYSSALVIWLCLRIHCARFRGFHCCLWGSVWKLRESNPSFLCQIKQRHLRASRLWHSEFRYSPNWSVWLRSSLFHHSFCCLQALQSFQSHLTFFYLTYTPVCLNQWNYLAAHTSLELESGCLHPLMMIRFNQPQFFDQFLYPCFRRLAHHMSLRSLFETTFSVYRSYQVLIRHFCL